MRIKLTDYRLPLTLILILLIGTALILSGCVTTQAKPPVVVVILDGHESPEDIQVRVQDAMAREVQPGEQAVTWINRYGGAAALIALPFLIW